MSDQGDEMTDVRQNQPVAQTRLLALGDWPAECLHCSWTSSSFCLPPELEHEVESSWKKAGERPGVSLFDGPLCRLEHFSCAAGLRLQLSHISYKYFIGTNGQHPQWAELYGQQVMANPVGTSVLLRSNDGQLICGQRNQSVALYPGCAHPFGGTLEPGKNGTPPNLMQEILRELSEEVHIQQTDLQDIRAIGLVEDRHLRQPELVYLATVNKTANTIAQLIDPDEHSASWMITDQPTSLTNTLATGNAITPVLAATLLAYGRWQHGESWLQRHLSDRHLDERAATIL
jgi:hypothetical protein